MSVNFIKKYLRISVGNLTHAILLQTADRYLQNITTEERILLLTVLPLQRQEVMFARHQNNLKSSEQILKKFSKNVVNDPRNSILNFGYVRDSRGTSTFDLPKIKVKIKGQVVLIMEQSTI